MLWDGALPQPQRAVLHQLLLQEVADLLRIAVLRAWARLLRQYVLPRKLFLLWRRLLLEGQLLLRRQVRAFSAVQ